MATTTTMPRARGRREWRRQGIVALAIEIGIGLVEDDQERARRRAPGRGRFSDAGPTKAAPAFADLGLVAIGKARIIHGPRPAWAAAITASAPGSASKRETFCATVPPNSSMSCRQIADVDPRASDDHWSRAAPSIRILP